MMNHLYIVPWQRTMTASLDKGTRDERKAGMCTTVGRQLSALRQHKPLMSKRDQCMLSHPDLHL